MRLVEILAPAVAAPRVLMTRRFASDYAVAARGFPQFTTNFASFLEFRRYARPDQSWGKKDAPLTALLKGWRHAHIVYGHALLIYQIKGDTIRLATIVEHNAVESGSSVATAGYVRGLSDADFEPFANLSAPVRGSVPLSAGEQREIADLMVLLAKTPADRAVLEQAARHDTADLMDWLRTVIGVADGTRDTAILAMFGSRSQLVKYVRRLLATAEAAVTEARRRVVTRRALPSALGLRA